MEAVEAFRPLGLIYFAIIWTAIFYVLRRWPGNATMTVSRHVATYREAYIFFAIVRTLASPLFILFIFGWFIPVFELPTAAFALMACGIAGDLTSAWIPEAAGWKGRVHRLSAYGMAATVLPFTTLIALAPGISSLARFLTYIAILFMIVFWILFVTSKKSKEYYLYFQLAYIILFDLAFLAAAFL